MVSFPSSVSSPVAAVVLAAGKGTRMQSSLPKVMHPVMGRPMAASVVATAKALGCSPLAVVTGPGMETVAKAVAPCPTLLQSERLGTGHAVLQAKELLKGFSGTLLVLYGDTPLLRAETLAEMIALREAEQAGVVVLGFRPEDPAGYGRLTLDSQGLKEIVEARDASPEQLRIGLCNSGVLAADAGTLWGWLERIGNANAKKEYYLTDVAALARAEGRSCLVVEGTAEELIGVNDRADLARCEAAAQARARAAAMAGGVTLVAPETVFFSYDTTLGRDVTVGPFTVFGPGVAVADGVEIKGFCHLEGCSIAAGAVVGPYARLRPQAEIGRNAHIGNFVEIKKAQVEDGVKISHLSYVGDARVGAGSNIGAGTITCNYDGYGKHRTEIEPGSFIGSNTALVAPVKVGAGAIVGAGSTIVADVPPDALAVARGRQELREGWAERFRARKRLEKDGASQLEQGKGESRTSDLGHGSQGDDAVRRQPEEFGG